MTTRARAGRAPRDTVNLAHLPASERRALWRGIQRLEPALAELLASEANLAAMRDRFGGQFEIRQAEYRRFLDAGREE